MSCSRHIARRRTQLPMSITRQSELQNLTSVHLVREKKHARARRRVHERVHEIDGVRGWAALSVLFFHLFWELFGGVVPAFRSSILRFWLDGPLAVYIFFVLSGDALSWPFLLT